MSETMLDETAHLPLHGSLTARLRLINWLDVSIVVAAAACLAFVVDLFGGVDIGYGALL